MILRLSHSHVPRRPAFVLVSVLVVVVLLTLAAYQYSELMMAEFQAMDSFGRTTQTRTLADSGVAYTAAMLSNKEALTGTLNGNPWDNSGAFHQVQVRDDPRPGRRGLFSVLALPGPDDLGNGQNVTLRHGVSDEAAKINLNALLLWDSTGNTGSEMLLALPNMTEEIANAILDWLDPDDTPRSNGAENEYYGTQTPSYRAKNGPLDSLEELLLVRGVTPQLLFGNDRNRNGVLDPDEDDGTGMLDLGWQAYLTVYSRNPNVDSEGNAHIFLNDKDIPTLQQKLTTALGEELANFIIAYRMYGGSGQSGQSSGQSGQSGQSGNQASPPSQGGSRQPSQGGSRQPSQGNQGRNQTPTQATPAPSSGSPSSGSPSSGSQSAQPAAKLSGTDKSTVQQQITTDSQSTNRRLSNIASVYGLVSATVKVTTGTGRSQKQISYPSPLMDAGMQKELLPLLLDKTTTLNQSDLPARINVNTAPRAVLMALPNITEADVNAIIEHRPAPSATTAPDPIFQTPAWLVTEANITAKTLSGLERFLTAGTQVYRFQVVGYHEGGGPTSRVEAIVDTNLGRPRVVYWRDMAELGRAIDPAKMQDQP